jgi:molybdopterin-guanine dinucleotide biosynthesis protein A
MSEAAAPGERMRVAPAWSLGVLAGGAGRRLGRDKASAPFAGTTLLEHLVRRLAPPGTPVLASTRADGPPVPDGVKRVDDAVPGLGPLAGLAALVAAASTKFVLVVACDAPLLPPETGDRLLKFATGVDAVLLRAAGRVEPFPALVAAELASRLLRMVAEGRRRADAWHEDCSAAYVPFETAFPGTDPARALLNANEAALLARAEEELRAERDARG